MTFRQTEYKPQHLAIDELSTVRDILRWAVSAFIARELHFGHGTSNAWDEARWLVLGALGLPFESPEWVLDARLTHDERQRLRGLLERRIEDREPVAYLLEESWFAGHRFIIDKRALIPRSPIAEMLHSDLQPWIGELQPERILDLCCGNGCIGIAAALQFPLAEVDLVDLSDDAIALAQQNIALHGLEDRVTVHKSDLLSALEPGQYDVILCNPPYVNADDMAALPAEYHHEPRTALAAGDDGLDLVHRILADARNFLKPSGLLVLEVGNSDEALFDAYPHLPWVWPEFEAGGDGVAVLFGCDLEAL